MPFDSILGVGRSPQVTADLILSPYALINSDISNSAEVTEVLDTITAPAGDKKNIVNPDFDSTTFAAYQLVVNHTVNELRTNVLTFDFSKIIYMRNLLFTFATTRPGTSSFTITIACDYSTDGIRWLPLNQISHKTPTSLIDDYVYGLSFFQTRFIRFTITSNISVGTTPNSITVDIFSLKAIMDNLQR